MGGRTECQQREDITLLLRNFNYPMPNAQSTQDTVDTNRTNTSSIDTESSDAVAAAYSQRRVEVGADGRVKPYVDFSDFYNAVEEAKEAGLITEDDMLYDVNPP